MGYKIGVTDHQGSDSGKRSRGRWRILFQGRWRILFQDRSRILSVVVKALTSYTEKQCHGSYYSIIQMQTQKNGLRQIGRHATIWRLLCSSQNEKRSSMARKDLVKCDDKTRAQWNNLCHCLTVCMLHYVYTCHFDTLKSCDLVILQFAQEKSLEVRFWRCAEAKSCELTCHISLESKQATHHCYHCWQKEFKFCIFIRFSTDKSALKPTPCSDFRPNNLTCV